MIFFNNDYSEIAAPEIITRIQELSSCSFNGYGLDEISDNARAKIRTYLEDDKCDIHFLVGGTQANLAMISAMLRPFEAVIAVDSGHINVHESASVEATGHKVETLPHHNGKMDPADLEKLAKSRNDEHMVRVKAVYISNSTEWGTVYTKGELKALRAVCDRYGLYLYMDGARLGSALTCSENDLTLKDINELCDCFYIGATKNGGMLGEAMVIRNDELKFGFRNIMKQRGALLAKGFLIGVQYECLFTDDLFFRLARHANEIADFLKEGLKQRGFRFFIESPSNQIFVYMNNNMIEELHREFVFAPMEVGEEESLVRLVTSWASRKEDAEALLKAIDGING